MEWTSVYIWSLASPHDCCAFQAIDWGKLFICLMKDNKYIYIELTAVQSKLGYHNPQNKTKQKAFNQNIHIINGNPSHLHLSDPTNQVYILSGAVFRERERDGPS